MRIVTQHFDLNFVVVFFLSSEGVLISNIANFKVGKLI